jgi:lipopolysaccharide biosynthesis glycosyltransferase
VLGRSDTEARAAALAARFPHMTFSGVPISGLGRGLHTLSSVDPSAEGLARLLLAELLPGVARIVQLPAPSVVTGDVAELADLELAGHVLAAATQPSAAQVSGFGMIHAAARRLGRRTDVASALRRTAHARHRFDFQAFSRDVLVLDAERLRATGFSDEALRLVEEFGLDELEVLHYLVGPNRAEVPERWAAVPTRTPERGAGLIHWADRVKPWQPLLTPERERWRRLAAELEQPGA